MTSHDNPQGDGSRELAGKELSGVAGGSGIEGEIGGSLSISCTAPDAAAAMALACAGSLVVSAVCLGCRFARQLP